jgi:endonuclease/exonuclease/phosphatase (EEP) superfamily protein YafD
MKKWLSLITCILLTGLSCSCVSYSIPGNDFLLTSDNRFEKELVSPDLCVVTRTAVTTALDPSSIKILSWNILEGNRESFYKNWSGDRDAWREDFFELSREADIVALQEFYLDSRGAEDVKQLEKGKGRLWWVVAKSFVYRRTKAVAGVLTLATAEMVFAGAFREKELLFKTPKTFLFTRYRLEGRDKELLVGNFHGVLVGRKSFNEQLDTLVQKLKAHDGPLIIAGDFNAYTKKRDAALKKAIASLQAKSVFDGLPPDNRTIRRGYALDDVFYRGLVLRKAPEVRQVETSDHNPILSEFELEEEVDSMSRTACGGE